MVVKALVTENISATQSPHKLHGFLQLISRLREIIEKFPKGTIIGREVDNIDEFSRRITGDM